MSSSNDKRINIAALSLVILSAAVLLRHTAKDYPVKVQCKWAAQMIADKLRSETGKVRILQNDEMFIYRGQGVFEYRFSIRNGLLCRYPKSSRDTVPRPLVLLKVPYINVYRTDMYTYSISVGGYAERTVTVRKTADVQIEMVK